MRKSPHGNNIWLNPRGGMLIHACEGFSLRTGKEAKKKPEEDTRDAPPFCEREVLHWLDTVASDYWYLAQMPIALGAIGAAIGRESVMLTRGEANPYYSAILQRISRVIPDIEERRLIFPEYLPPVTRRKSENQLDLFGGESDQTRADIPQFIWTEAPDTVPVIKRLSVASSWSLFARCASCHGNKFLPVSLHGLVLSHVACYHCLPPGQYRSVTATAVKTSLIHRAAREYY